jgi:hypothetical protein
MGRHPSKESLKWPRVIRRYREHDRQGLCYWAEDETARLRIALARIVRPQVAMKPMSYRRVEASPSTLLPPRARERSGFHARAWRRARPKPGPRPASIDEIGTVICDAYHEMHMRVVGVPMGDADPVQPGAEVTLHLADQVTGECLDVGHLGGILRGDDEAEMMPVVGAASREGHGVGAVLGSAEHAALLAVPG